MTGSSSICRNMIVHYVSSYYILLDCLRRCLKLFEATDSTSSHEFSFQFGLAIVLYTKNTQKLSRRPSLAQVYVECAGHGRSIASDNNNSDHSGERKRHQRDCIPSRLGKSGLGLLVRSLCVCTVCVCVCKNQQ